MALREQISPSEWLTLLLPSFLTIFPVLVLVAAHVEFVDSGAVRAVIIFASCGGVYLLTFACRERGMKVETLLFMMWGSEPATILMRHRDGTIDEGSKLRCHNFLAEKTCMAFPTSQEEERWPHNADDIYTDGVVWLLEKTRGTDAFPLLQKKYRTYALMRNALGMRRLGVTLCLLTILWVLLTNNILSFTAKPYLDFGAILTQPPGETATMAVSAFMLLLWGYFFTFNAARRTAFRHAATLIGTCESLRLDSGGAK